MRIFFLFTICGIIVFALSLSFRLGAFKTVMIHEPRLSNKIYILFKKHTGPYQKINLSILSVEALAKKIEISCPKTFGEFIDDPKSIPEDRLRSHVGCVLDSAMNLESKLPKGFFYKVIAPRNTLSAFFDGSPSIGPFKVYPKVSDYLSNLNMVISGPVIEIYELINNERIRTQYLFPIKHK